MALVKKDYSSILQDIQDYFHSEVDNSAHIPGTPANALTHIIAEEEAS